MTEENPRGLTPSPLRSLSGNWLVAAFLLLAAGIGALWYSAISAYEAAVLRDRGRELQAIAELKIEFIRFWLSEKRGDAAIPGSAPLMARAAEFGIGRGDMDGAAVVLGRLDAFRKAHGYENVMLLDRAGHFRAEIGPQDDLTRARIQDAASTAMEGGKTHISRAYASKAGGRTRLDIDIATPVISGDKLSPRIVGALVFHLTPQAHLDPLLQKWPSPSESGETILVEHSGGRIVYLNSLRHADAAATQLNEDDPSLPAALAARGQQGVIEGIDYRGVPVLAAVGQVPDMPWYVVAKLDRAEILAPVRREALWSGSLSALLVLALGLAMFSWRRRGQSELALAQQTASREALRANEARFRKLIENAWDFHVLFDRGMDITYISPSVAHHLGHDLLGKSIAKGTAIVHPEDVALVEEARAKALANPGIPQRFEHRLRRRDERWLTVEAFFVNQFDDPDINALTYTGRDITERREAEAKRLIQAHQQRDTLVREVHHRIKNHLQGLAGLLNQHRRQHPDQEDALEAVSAQISAISVIHGLQGRDASGEVRLFRLLKEIVSFLGSRAAVEFTNAVNPACHNCAWRISDEESVPVALVINELVTNAIKHQAGSPDGQPAPVRIDCVCNGERIVVTVRNPGVLPRGFDFAAGSGLGTGLTLVRSLLSHEGAVLSIASGVDGMVETRLTLAPPVVSSKAAASAAV